MFAQPECRRPLGRRFVLLGAAAAGVLSASGQAQTAPPDLVEAANREGAATFYTSIDIAVAEKVAAAFTARYPKIELSVQRSGAERLLQRLAREQQGATYAADVVESSDVTSFIDWKQRGWLADFVPDDVAAYWPPQDRDPDGTFAAVRAHLSVVGYNTTQVAAADAPARLADLLLPKWHTRMVKANPNYSVTVLAETASIVQALGWRYFETLARQQVLQVQSATEPPKAVAQGERSIMCDGIEYDALSLREAGEAIEIVYPKEGSPLIPCQAAVLKQAPHPNAARLFATFLFSQECQQLMCDVGGMRSFHPKVVLKPGRKPLSEIKVLRADPAALAQAADAIKARYDKVFGL